MTNFATIKVIERQISVTNANMINTFKLNLFDVSFIFYVSVANHNKSNSIQAFSLCINIKFYCSNVSIDLFNELILFRGRV